MNDLDLILLISLSLFFNVALFQYIIYFRIEYRKTTLLICEHMINIDNLVKHLHKNKQDKEY